MMKASGFLENHVQLHERLLKCVKRQRYIVSFFDKHKTQTPYRSPATDLKLGPGPYSLEGLA